MHVLQEALEEGGSGLNLLLIVGLALESREVLVRSPPASNSGKSARDMNIMFADFTADGFLCSCAVLSCSIICLYEMLSVSFFRDSYLHA